GNVRVWCPPSIGEQVQLLCVDGDLANAVAVPGMFSDAFPAPSSNPNLLLIQFTDGATLGYDSDAHALAANLPTGGTVSIVADGGVSIAGPVTIQGDVTVTGKAEVSEDVIGGGVSLK
ncbi:phage baseplate assembly protein V, partial [Mesorhizobium sp. M8A.F.Ca.ET.142.01.1.1]|uniref:phage baseplate assembly protein V n=1 Tax=Mesorhizobium sp. M8A.F.Ca.ET.142.01.1.1 TaxID=2563958 RepID=UPI001093C546